MDRNRRSGMYLAYLLFYCITKTFASPSTFSSLRNSESSCYFWAMEKLRRRTSLIGPRWQASFWMSSRRSGINLHKTWGRRKGVFHTRRIYRVTWISILLWRLWHTTCFARKLDSLNIGAVDSISTCWRFPLGGKPCHAFFQNHRWAQGCA